MDPAAWRIQRVVNHPTDRRGDIRGEPEDLLIEYDNYDYTATKDAVLPVLQLVLGRKSGAVVSLAGEGVIEVAEYTEIWEGISGPLRPARRWSGRLLFAPEPVEPDYVGRLVSGVRLVQKWRRDRFIRCTGCARRVAPEYQHDNTYCMSCASTYLGVVY